MKILDLLLPPLEGHCLIGLQSFGDNSVLLRVSPAAFGGFWVATGRADFRSGTLVWKGPQEPVSAERLYTVVISLASGMDYNRARWVLQRMAPQAYQQWPWAGRSRPVPGSSSDMLAAFRRGPSAP